MTDSAPYASVAHVAHATPDNALIPKRVVLAIIAQLALASVDVGSLGFVTFGLIGMMASTNPPDPTGDLVMSVMVIGYGLTSSLGLGLGIAASTGLYRGSTWARPAAIAHGVVSVISCCPFNWGGAALAMLTANHPDVRAWPSLPARDLAETFR